MCWMAWHRDILDCKESRELIRRQFRQQTRATICFLTWFVFISLSFNCFINCIALVPESFSPLFSNGSTRVKVYGWGFIFNDRSWKLRVSLDLWPPHASRFLVSWQKILTCRLVCGEFRQAYDKIGPYRAISGSARSQNIGDKKSAFYDKKMTCVCGGLWSWAYLIWLSIPLLIFNFVLN